MDRRTIIKHISLMTGAAFVGGELFVKTGCKADKTNPASSILTAQQVSLLDEIGETILPQTDTPGAKAVGIGLFMNKMITNCYTKEQQSVFLSGVETLKTDFQKKYAATFEKGSPDQREEFLNSINAEMVKYNKDKKQENAEHYFTMIKQLTILGYFTSEAGATKELRYEAVPGRYDGSYPYKKGDKAWAT
ncbi:MAG: gluconate 2-dehydrogenase subunit 3 family protein [Saprospiraceae bacterium]|nr:gluconate 2-dehydrogenase subunit 3 family protein [Saprospiraceae bacterium]